MQISNIRLGHATNSSSTHSLIMGIDAPAISPNDEDQFGWDWFHLVSPEEKLQYLATQLYQRLSSWRTGIGERTARYVVNSVFDIFLPDNAGIDHQSHWFFPLKRARWGVDEIDYEFLEEVRNFILREDVTILGGNDNEDIEEDGPKSIVEGLKSSDASFIESKQFPITREIDHYAVYSRKDGDWWVLYNTKTGAKIRFSFKDNPKAYTKASYPELVDLKITDFCEKRCDFCYQDSTWNGQHASLDNINNVFSTLSSLDVFEVALGGGEPTAHPCFAEILKEAKERYGITPNFSTATLDWLFDTNKVEAVRKYCGGFAISLAAYSPSFEDISKIDAEGLADKASFQCILGIYPGTGDGSSILNSIDCFQNHINKITLLGKKTTGRGKNKIWATYNLASMIEKLDSQGLQIGVDTAIVKQHEDVLRDMEINNIFWSGAEGAFSMYIDAVKSVIAPSSYVETENMISFDSETYEESGSSLIDKIREFFPFYENEDPPVSLTGKGCRWGDWE